MMAWSIDDPGIPKKGIHTVGFARQYCGNLGKEDNCHVAVSLRHHYATLCIAAYGFLGAERSRLYPVGLWRSYRQPDYPVVSTPEGLLARPERHHRAQPPPFDLTYARS